MREIIFVEKVNKKHQVTVSWSETKNCANAYESDFRKNQDAVCVLKASNDYDHT